MADPVRVVALGGSLRSASTSLTALRVALDAATAAGATPTLMWIRELDLPMYAPGQAIPASARTFADTVHACDAMIWGTPTYHGSVSGSFKNALDWLILLADRDPPYLTGKPVGLVSTAGGVQGLQAINSLDFIARALRGWSVPLVLPVARSQQAFDADGRLIDQVVAAQLHALGAEVVRAARQFHAEGTCDYAETRQYAHEHDARRPAATADVPEGA